jgi:hypothetical protein
MRVVPRAFGQLVRYMLVWTLHQVRCLPCYFTRTVLDSPHERWRVWHSGGPLGLGVGWLLVAGWFGLVTLFALNAKWLRVLGLHRA